MSAGVDGSKLQRLEALVIGASAGGVDALMRVLPALPARTALPVIVVLHLPRQHRSALVDIFRPKCALPVAEAEDKEPIVQGTVYFAPPDYHVLVDVGPTIALSADDAVNFSRPSIDVLFESAADFYGDAVGAVILTGANADGAAGLDAVRRSGGVTIVQRPDTASSPAMPTAALERGAVDFMLPLEGIARLLGSLPVG